MYNSVKWREDYVIYMIAEPDTVLKRIIQRGTLDIIRKKWNEYEKEYLLKILSFYNDFLFSSKPKNKVFIINTEYLTTHDVLREIENIITNISGKIFSTCCSNRNNNRCNHDCGKQFYHSHIDKSRRRGRPSLRSWLLSRCREVKCGSGIENTR